MTNQEINKLAAETFGMEYEIERQSTTDGSYYISRTFNPCENIADSWLLVEKMVHLGLTIEKKDRLEYGKWRVEFESAGSSNGDVALADTAPMTITLACLKAKGVDCEEAK